MYTNVSAAFMNVLRSEPRNRAYVSVTLGLVNAEAQGNATASGITYYSEQEKAIRGNQDSTVNYDSFEPNYFKMDGSLVFLPRVGSEYYFQGLVSDSMDNPSIVISFPKAESFYGLTMLIPESNAAYFTSIQVNGVSAEKVSGDKWTVKSNFDDVTSLTITATGTHRLKIYSLTCGIGLYFDNNNISEADFTTSTDLISEDLPETDFSFTILDPDQSFNPEIESSYYSYLTEKMSVTIRSGFELDDGTVEYVPIAYQFLKTWNYNDKAINFTTQSIVDYLSSLGTKDAYTTGSTNVKAVIESHYADVLSYLSIDDLLSSVSIDATIPKGTIPQQLQILAMAGRCYMTCDTATTDTSTNTITPILSIKNNVANTLEPSDLTINGQNEAYFSDLEDAFDGDNEYWYAFLSDNSFVMDASKQFPPREGSSDAYKSVGWVSNTVSDGSSMVSIGSVIFPTSMSYYKITMELYNVEYLFITDPTTWKTTSASDIVDGVNTIDLSALVPFSRLNIQVRAKNGCRGEIRNVAFSTTSNYYLSRSNMYSYKTISDELPEQIVFWWYDSTGAKSASSATVIIENGYSGTFEFDNQAIPYSQLTDVCKWVADYYKGNIEYEIEYLGDPRLQVGDLIFIENSQSKDCEVQISEISLDFNSGLRGTMKLHKVIGDA